MRFREHHDSVASSTVNLIPEKAPTTQYTPEVSDSTTNLAIGQDLTPEPENEIKGVRLLVLHSAMCLCMLLVGLDFTVVPTIVPVITDHFGSTKDIGWYGATFYMTFCVSTPLAGKLYTLFPKRPVYLVSLAIFEIGSLICGLASSSGVLIAGRCVTGIGGSGIFAGGLIILTVIVPLHKRAIFTGTMASLFTIANLFGPVLGGAFATHVSWRWCFLINLPIGAVVAAVVFFAFKLKNENTPDASWVKRIQQLDLFGFMLFSGSIVLLLLALQWAGERYAWKSAVIIVLFICSSVLLFAFAVWQWKAGSMALIPINLFANRNATLTIVASFFANGPFQIIIYWLPIWFQATLDVSPLQSGVRYLPTVISDLVTSLVGSGLMTATGVWGPFQLLAMSTISIGSGLLTTLNSSSPLGSLVGFQILGGVGYSLSTNTGHLALQSSLPPELVPVGATTLVTTVFVSGAIFLAAGQAAFQSQLTHNLASTDNADLVQRILSVGVTQFRDQVQAEYLPAVIKAYSKSITTTFYIPAATAALAFLLVCGVSWNSTKGRAPKASSTEDA